MRRNQKGFTLVELIIVIAIMAILAGVGTVTYAHYIEVAHKAADQQTVADISYAIRLAQKAHPELLNGSAGVVVLTDNSEPVVTLNGAASDSFRESIKDAVSYLDDVRLQYGWENGELDGGTVSTIFNAVNESGLQALIAAGYSVGYAGNADFMWDEVMDAAALMGGVLHEKDGSLVYEAASLTNGWDSNKILDIWGDTEASIFDKELSDPSDGATGAAAYIAAAVARNYAFAEYAKQYGVSDDTVRALQSWENVAGLEEDDSENKSYAISDAVFLLKNWETEGNSDADMMAAIIKADAGDMEARAKIETEYGDTTDMDEQEYKEFLREAMAQEFKLDYPNLQDIPKLQEAAAAYTTRDANGNSQADVDGIGYYTLMKSLTNLSDDGGGFDSEDPNYLESIRPYVTMAGKVADGKNDIAALNTALSSISIPEGAESAVIIVALPSEEFMYTPSEVLE